MFGAVPKSAWMRRYPSDERNRCVLAMRSLVVQLDDGRVMLIDTGAGEKHLQQLSYYAFFNQVDLLQALSALGISAEQVTDGKHTVWKPSPSMPLTALRTPNGIICA